MQAAAKSRVLGFGLSFPNLRFFMGLILVSQNPLHLLLKFTLATMPETSAAAACHCLSLCPGSWPCSSSTSSHMWLATSTPSHRQILGLATCPLAIPRKNASSGYLGVWFPGPIANGFRWACAGMPWIWGWCPSAFSEVQVGQHTNTVPAEPIAPCWPVAWRLGFWLVVCEIAKHKGLLIRLLHTFYSTIFYFFFFFSLLISCVFQRSWAKTCLIPLCFILRSKGRKLHTTHLWRNLFRLLCGQFPRYFCFPHLLLVWCWELRMWSLGAMGIWEAR